MKKKTVDLFKEMLKVLEPAPDLTIGEWADKYRILSKESSAESGKWQTSRTPYMVDIYNCLTDSLTESVTIKSSAQIGKSEMLINILGRYIHLDPCSILFVQPTVDDAKAFSKERVEPMIRDTKILRELIKKANKKSEGTVQGKMYDPKKKKKKPCLAFPGGLKRN